MVSVLTARDNVVDRYVDDNRIFAGGNAVNVAVFARRAAARSAYAGTVGTDAAGALIRGALSREDVCTDLLLTRPGSTAHCVIRRQEGERYFGATSLGVSRTDFQDDFAATASRFDAVHISESSRLENMIPRLGGSSRLSFDFAVNRDGRLVGSVAPHCFLASFSGGDLTRADALALAHHAAQQGATWSLVTRGGAGALLVGRNRCYEVAAAPTTLVDTLGAGDTFIATLLVRILQGTHPAEAMDRASKAAAQTCARLGAFGEGQPFNDRRYFD
ncbi:PfkB family carbohydrate kinase [Pseudarthrobacter sulfonivorans]|uniref:PfkB family carbohydrate kinase n=1 Tax=Pseudarthrobacter sulfonivorans TaxID=121292 RepID=UPI00168B99B9|nr:PfkB family carbohydrate kinase [Pseudarthrobacter sulfonivorans]